MKEGERRMAGKKSTVPEIVDGGEWKSEDDVAAQSGSIEIRESRARETSVAAVPKCGVFLSVGIVQESNFCSRPRNAEILRLHVDTIPTTCMRRNKRDLKNWSSVFYHSMWELTKLGAQHDAQVAEQHKRVDEAERAAI
ncbi:hypothetical protein AXG93_4485s1120 [Marchantia polymorpha subsp. ruderalis]|uniref:Uncharacterized protein n=1 Tax=Marchantia polymorpha subsp. ruderalis TaxID=1480154 RepID=A0A176WI00_MARPO|nr:hypothetical protein AXG93_4485s1120 [Marchantia polymorpha subsp. ruderalis]